MTDRRDVEIRNSVQKSVILAVLLARLGGNTVVTAKEVADLGGCFDLKIQPLENGGCVVNAVRMQP